MLTIAVLPRLQVMDWLALDDDFKVPDLSPGDDVLITEVSSKPLLSLFKLAYCFASIVFETEVSWWGIFLETSVWAIIHIVTALK